MNVVYGGRNADEAIEELLNKVNPKNNSGINLLKIIHIK